MKQKIQVAMILLLLWLLLVVVTSQVRAGEVGKRNDFMGDQVYSVYLERSNYLHEVDSGRAERNAELDKALGIQIDVLCNAWGRTLSQCWLQMVYEVGGEYRPFRGF